MRIRTILIVIAAIALLYWPTQYILAAASANSTTDQEKQDNGAASSLLEGHPYDNYKNDNLDANSNTPEAYRPPQFDPFNNKYRTQYDYKEVLGPVTDKLDTAPYADFSVQPDRQGLPDYYSGTTTTTFVFSGNLVSDSETSSNLLEVRWDYESDGKPDTFFSRNKVERHQFKTAGVYPVTMEVLDRGGNVSKITKKVTVVENTPPSAYFTFKPETGTNNTIFSFDTSRSADSQYSRNTLKYRFDWDSDGKWDTTYNSKTGWRHKFEGSGAHNVTMEAVDPEGATSQAYATINTFENSTPVALFTIAKAGKGFNSVYIPGPNFKVYYIFDASASNDQETATNKLKYRWDFNYTGKDDIVYDTSWSTNPKYNGYYSVPGKKVIKLQVKDEDGAVSEMFASIEVPSGIDSAS